MRKSKRKKVYLPPDRDAVDEFARRVCEAVDENDFEVITGLANFVNSVGKAYANFLNTSQESKSDE
ncbi:MAG: hypothetical protein AAFV93_16535 [Chloroflexota bacterium]